MTCLYPLCLHGHRYRNILVASCNTHLLFVTVSWCRPKSEINVISDVGVTRSHSHHTYLHASTTHMQPIGLMMIYINNKKRSCWILAMNEVNSTHHQVNHILICLNWLTSTPWEASLGAAGDEEVVLRHTTMTEVHVTSTNSSYVPAYMYMYENYTTEQRPQQALCVSVMAGSSWWLSSLTGTQKLIVWTPNGS